MPSLRVATWNIAGARREDGRGLDLAAVVAGVRGLGADLLAVQEVDRSWPAASGSTSPGCSPRRSAPAGSSRSRPP